MRIFQCICAGFFALTSFTVWSSGAELSVMTGSFSSTKLSDHFKQTHLSLGSKYSHQFSNNMFWYGSGLINFEMYKTDWKNAPGNNLGLEVGGGVRYYFERINPSVVPFSEFGTTFKNIRDFHTENGFPLFYDCMGIFYNTDVGLRVSFDPDFFLDLHTAIISSPLYAQEKTVRYSKQQDALYSDVTKEEVKFALFAKSFSAFSEVKISFGMRL